jgi:hypothetical protein
MSKSDAQKFCAALAYGYKLARLSAARNKRLSDMEIVRREVGNFTVNCRRAIRRMLKRERRK